MMSWKSLFSSPDQAETTGSLAEIRETAVKRILFRDLVFPQMEV